MKRFHFIPCILLVLCAVLVFTACSAEETKQLTVTDYLADQAEVDARLMEECKSGYAFTEPLIVVNPYGNAPLSAVAVFSTEEAVGGTVTVHGKAEKDDVKGTFEAAKDHYVPIYGLYAGTVNKVTLALDNGSTADIEIETEPLDLGLKDFAVKMIDSDKYDYDTLTICANMILHCDAGYDSEGDLRWALTGTGSNAITRLENGHFLIPNIYGHGAEFPNGLTGIREIDPLGKVYNTYVWDGGEHHEIIVMPNGNYMITGSRPGYATNRDYIFEINPVTGEVAWDLDIAELITPGSSGCENDKGADWCHSNALAYDEATDTLLISCRHICAVIAVEKSTKTLKWIFGDPAGWDEKYASYLLKAPEGFEYAYGQHEIVLMGEGNLLMFDNGEFGRVKMVNADKALDPKDNYSRIVIYNIDEEAKTVSQVWEYGREYGYFAGSMSGEQVLGENRYLVTWGTCEDDDGAIATHIQLVQDDKAVWQLDYRGSNTYRAYRYNLYGGAYDPSIKGAWHGDMSETKQLEGALGKETKDAPKGVQVTLFPFEAVRFSGSFEVEDESKLAKYFVALVNQNGESLFFDLGYTTSKAEAGIKVNLSRWVSLKGLPEGTYEIKLVVNDETWNTGYSVVH